MRRDSIVLICFTFSLAAAPAKPVIFWQPDSILPGNAVLLYGGGLAALSEVQSWRLPDGVSGPIPGSPAMPADPYRIPIAQAAEESLKFVIPAAWKPGVFAVRVDARSSPILINRPELWFVQSVPLQPGLDQNQAPPGSEIQIVGKDFLLADGSGSPRILLRAVGQQSSLEAQVTKSERFSLRARLPRDLAVGEYELWVQNGFGGGYGWGGPLRLRVKKPDVWPTKVFDVKKDFGAKGDDVNDDTAAFEAALAAARNNGGGVVFIPWGIYRLSRTIVIPPRTALRGEQRDASVLMWPVDEPKSIEEFGPAAIFGQAPYAVEDLSIIARKVNFLLEDVGYGQGVPPELRKGHDEGEERDVFIRRVNFQHWILAGRGKGDNLGNKYGMDGVTVLGINGVTNFELSDTQTQGAGSHIRNIRNARETGNSFSNMMGYCWVEMGGGAHYVVSEGNEIRCSSSWGYGHIAMKYLYSAHNRSYNFVRGEREGMTLDISALPTARPGKNIAWFGKPEKVEGLKFTLNGIQAQNDEFKGLYLMVLDGPGRGQFREILSNTPTEFTVDHPWDVQPGTSSTIGLWSVMQHMIVYKSEGFDTSAFAQLWGSFYDYIIDDCRVERSQGIWGQNGWFVQFRNNDVAFANTYHPGIGPGGGPTPERTQPYGFVGLSGGGLRVTKFGSAQYNRQLVMVDEVAGSKVPGTAGVVIRGNHLRFNHRIAFPPSAQPVTRDHGESRMFDVLIDGNTIEHAAVGVQIGGQCERVLLKGNRFNDVALPYAIARPETVKMLDGNP